MSESATPKIKIAPSSKESEMMVLGCMLTSINSLNIAADSLDDSDFYFTEHKIIFQVLKESYKKDKPADVHLVCEELKRQNKLSSVGGVAYVTTLAQYAGTSAYIEEYTEIIRNKSILRKMIHASQLVEKSALDEPADVGTALDDAQQLFFKISQSANPIAGVLIKDLLSGVKSQSAQPLLKELQERQERYMERGPEDLGITGIPSHFADLDKMLNGLNQSNLMILAARPAMGKCVVKGTPILNPETGALTPIEDLVEQKTGKVATLGNNWKFHAASPSAYIADGVKPTFQVTTALGKEIEATAVHPLLTINGWKRLEELKVGDKIAVPRRLPYFGKKHWPSHQLKILAYLIAGGTLTETQPTFTHVNPKIIADFKEAALAFGKTRVHEQRHKNRVPTFCIALERFFSSIKDASLTAKHLLMAFLIELGPSPATVLSGTHGTIPSDRAAISLRQRFPEGPSVAERPNENPVAAFLKKLSLFGKEAHQKQFPKEIFELVKEDLALLINRLFSCHGTIHIDTREGSSSPLITYTSASKKLIQQLQHLLLRFGILSKIRKTEEKPIFSYELEIHGEEDLALFYREIGIYGKEDALSSLLKQSIAISTQMASSDVYWDRITFIASTGKKEVFDLTVETTHNFVASDIIVHNTALALNVAENICFKTKLPVGIFSLEMSAEQLLHRIICSQAQVESEKIKTGSLNGIEFQRIVASVNDMQKHTMIIDDQPGLKITDLRARARRMKETHSIGFLVIDYLQLISGSNTARSMENRQNEISEISRMLKTLARELDLPILCLSQLSRKVEDRTGHRPMMSDLRESGCLAGDTLITDAATGKCYTIKELAERTEQTPLQVHAIDSSWNMGMHTMSRVFYSGRKIIYKLTTRTGRSIKASANHPFLKQDGWIRLDQLQVHDQIAVPLQTHLKSRASEPALAHAGSTPSNPSSGAQHCVKSEIQMDEIVSIIQLDEQDVYDATVDEVHNFVANDILVHNSIEQDADIVMFLLRREYYDPLDKPGMAELIVAKNRHGGVGSINLTFRKEIAQFANYTPIQSQVSYDPEAEEAFKAFSPPET